MSTYKSNVKGIDLTNNLSAVDMDKLASMDSKVGSIEENAVMSEISRLGNTMSSSKPAASGTLPRLTPIPEVVASAPAADTQARYDRLKLKKYLIHPRISEKLKTLGLYFDPAQVPRLSPTEVKLRLQVIRDNISASYSDKVINHLTENGLGVYEKVLCQFYDCEGIKDNLMKVPDFRDLLDELSVETVMPTISVHLRIGLAILQATVTQHQINIMLRQSGFPVGNQSTGASVGDLNTETHMDEKEVKSSNLLSELSKNTPKPDELSDKTIYESESDEDDDDIDM